MIAYQDQVANERARSDQILGTMGGEVNKLRAKLHDEKMKRRKDVSSEVEKRKALKSDMQEQLVGMDDWLNELDEEVKHAKRVTKAALKEKNKLKAVSDKRLTLLKELRVKLSETKDDLAEESNQRAALERMQTIGIQIKKERTIDRREGSGRWPVHVFMLICELLVNGTPHSAIPANIQSSHAAI